MYRFINLTVFVLIALYTSTVHAQQTITLNPNENKVLTNNVPWTINATCTVQIHDQTKSKIKLNVLKNSGSVNGKNLAKGETTIMTVRNETSIEVSAEAGTEINLENKGAVELTANCST